MTGFQCGSQILLLALSKLIAFQSVFVVRGRRLVIQCFSAVEKMQSRKKMAVALVFNAICLECSSETNAERVRVCRCLVVCSFNALRVHATVGSLD